MSILLERYKHNYKSYKLKSEILEKHLKYIFDKHIYGMCDICNKQRTRLYCKEYAGFGKRKSAKHDVSIR